MVCACLCINMHGNPWNYLSKVLIETVYNILFCTIFWLDLEIKSATSSVAVTSKCDLVGYFCNEFRYFCKNVIVDRGYRGHSRSLPLVSCQFYPLFPCYHYNIVGPTKQPTNFQWILYRWNLKENCGCWCRHADVWPLIHLLIHYHYP